MAQQNLNADDAKNQGYVHHTPSSSKEPAKITTKSSHHITMTPKPNEEILIRCDDSILNHT
ncbi:hypothetical protein MKW92_013380 [Papaver armeniacum]|nr:hypothetical protein MKW92_013380 [Papaver armeniacum]